MGVCFFFVGTAFAGACFEAFAPAAAVPTEALDGEASTFVFETPTSGLTEVVAVFLEGEGAIGVGVEDA